MVNVLGIEVSSWEPNGLVDAMVRSARRPAVGTPGALRTVLYANVHVLNVAYTDPALHQQLRQGSTVYCDGSGVRLGAWMLGQTLPPRLTAADWVEHFCARAAHDGLGLYLLGGAACIAEQAAHRLQKNHEGLRIVGTHHGYLNDELSRQVVTGINGSGADVVIVGMGTPRQELWVRAHRASIHAPVVWCVGALFDFVAAVQKRAPSSVRKHHLEWIWRLFTDPVRLSGRYLIGNPLFCLRVLRQRFFGLPAWMTDSRNLGA